MFAIFDKSELATTKKKENQMKTVKKFLFIPTWYDGLEFQELTKNKDTDLTKETLLNMEPDIFKGFMYEENEAVIRRELDKKIVWLQVYETSKNNYYIRKVITPEGNVVNISLTQEAKVGRFELGIWDISFPGYQDQIEGTVVR
jgi:hypothetical protein